MTAATDPSSTSESVIKALELDRHIEGGYFRRTFVSDYSASQGATSLGRKTMSSIYYLLNAESPVGHFHRNKSDIVHYFHMGDPIAYFLIHPDGELQEVTLGHNIEEDHKLQLVVPGGVWKASRLKANGAFGYGLISEAVSPSFNYDDMTLGSSTLLKREFPQHGDLIDKLSYPAPR
jgi:predicted cupin superfamily sugar epimerase